MPDIDLDFPRDIRERLIPGVHERYGRERAALVSAFAGYRSRGAVRPRQGAGAAGGEIERVAGSRTCTRAGTRSSATSRRRSAPAGGSPRWRDLARLAERRGGYTPPLPAPGRDGCSTRPLVDLCPVQPAAMEGRQIVQWDKDSCADAGFLKIDLLGLGMLSAVERCVEMVAEARGERIDLSRIPLDDPPTFEAIGPPRRPVCSRSRAGRRCRCCPQPARDARRPDRPGGAGAPGADPGRGGTCSKRRRLLREDPGYEVPYEHPDLEPILSDTLGAIVFQDQVIQVAMAMAGFSAGEAEGLRRAMSRKRSEAALAAYEEQFVAGCGERGSSGSSPSVSSSRCAASASAFPSRTPPPSACSPPVDLAAVHYGPEFLCALFNEQPMGFYPRTRSPTRRSGGGSRCGGRT